MCIQVNDARKSFPDAGNCTCEDHEVGKGLVHWAGLMLMCLGLIMGRFPSGKVRDKGRRGHLPALE